MKKLAILLGILLVGVLFAAPANAVVNQTIQATTPPEVNLWDIATGWGFAGVTQADLESASALASLPAGSYTVNFLARYAADDNDAGAYVTAATAPLHSGSVSLITGSGLDPDTNPFNSAVNVTFSSSNPNGISFFNNDMTESRLGTTQNQNASLPINTYNNGQSSGFIFDLKAITGNAAYAGDYLVAFEDGDSNPILNDFDYNDLVFEVKANAVPIPPSALLFGSGLLGLVGWRRFKKN